MADKELKCKKCGHVEKVIVESETKTGPGGFSIVNTFMCRDCDRLTTLDTVKQKLYCQYCKSSNLTKFFPETRVKCSKCGTQGFGGLKI